MATAIDYTGRKFGRLTVIEKVGHNKHSKVLWRCKCKCGNYTTLTSSEIKREKTKSCGCMSGDNNRKSLCSTCVAPMCEWLLSSPSREKLVYWEKLGFEIEVIKNGTNYFLDAYRVKKCPWYKGGKEIV